MTVKKTLSLKRPTVAAKPPSPDAGESAPAESGATSPAPAATGGATIADRFKLDAPVQAKPAGAGVAAKVAVVAGLAALAVAGILAYTLYGHWEFLKGA